MIVILKNKVKASIASFYAYQLADNQSKCEMRLALLNKSEQQTLMALWVMTLT